MPKLTLVEPPPGKREPVVTGVNHTLMSDHKQPAPGPHDGSRNRSESRDTTVLAGADLGLAVAREVMGWHSDHEQYTDCWVTADGRLTGYYYGRPFSPYRDRNALAEVWKRVEALGLRARYVEALESLLAATQDPDQPIGTWSLHTCNPELACRAALLAVRQER